MRRSQGQISILIIFSFIPMFTLLAFVVNIGMLVNAKISLQNAADFAAYAGAATQARQMTHISHLNYAMREAYKKFLFKYYVIGNINLKCYPRPNMPDSCKNQSGVFDWINPDSSNTGSFPGAPIVCLSLSTETNPCQLAKAVPFVKPPPCIPLDPTCDPLRKSAQTIADIQKASCSLNSSINANILIYWLYATNYDATIESNVLLQGLVSGDIGLVTEELLLYSRIQNVLQYVNEQPKTGVTFQAIKNNYESAPDLPKVERTVLAFKTAYNNLNRQVFFEDSVVMDELMPKGFSMLNLKPIDPDIDTGFAFLAGDNNEGCAMQISTLKAKPIVGVYKVPDSYVYYAVKLSAKARLLFNPFPFSNPDEGIELTAYAAAAPFGSRIGPELSVDDFRKVTGKVKTSNGSAPEEFKYPTLRVNNEFTWEHTEILKKYYNILAQGITTNSSGQVAGIGSLKESDMERGINTARLPDEDEVGKYNMAVDTDKIGVEAGERHEFVPYYRKGNDKYSFWAPIIPPNGKDEFEQKMKKELDKVAENIGNASVDNSLPTQVKTAMASKLNGDLQSLLGSLKKKSEYNVARLKDPLSRKYFGSNPTDMIGKVKDPMILATSYTTDHDVNYYINGRDGYSVKLIPFRNLLSSPGNLTNIGGEKKWPTIIDTFNGERTELMKVAH